MSDQSGSFLLTTHRPAAGVVVVAVAGDLDISTAPDLDLALREVLTGDVRIVVVDLTGVAFLGSAGLGTLVSAHRRSGEPGRLRIVVPDGEIARLFRVTGLHDLLTLYLTCEQALAEE